MPKWTPSGSADEVTEGQIPKMQAQMKKLLPIRNSIIKRYFDKFKYQRNKRNDLLAAVEESEELLRDLFGDEYRHFSEEIPEIKEFLLTIEKKEKIIQEQREKYEEDDDQVRKDAVIDIHTRGKGLRKAQQQI